MRDDDLGLTYYTYDAGNRMTSVKNPFGEVAYYEYSPGGRNTKRILGNGCVTYYDYDAIGQVAKVDNRKSDLSVISSFEYEGDPVGNPVSILREDGSVVYYEYDAKHQLTRETQRDSEGQDIYAWEWDYDPAGNRTYQIFNGVTTYYQYNEANELTEETTDGVTTYYSYDRCGNTTAKQEPTGTTYYHWDYENLLTQIDLPDGAHNYFTYDADSKRVSKQDSEGFTEFIYQGPDMLKLLLERDEQGTTQAHYTMGSGLESMRRDSTSSFYHFDALGCTFDLTDAAEDVSDTYLYNAWGEVLERTGSTVNPHTYVGRERYYLTPDPIFCLLGLRYYVARVGRFWTTDPIRDGVKWFVYAENRPITRLDARGLQAETERDVKHGHGWFKKIIGGVPCYDHRKSHRCGRASYAMVVGTFKREAIAEARRDTDPEDWSDHYCYQEHLCGGEGPPFWKLAQDSGRPYKEVTGKDEHMIASIAASILDRVRSAPSLCSHKVSTQADTYSCLWEPRSPATRRLGSGITRSGPTTP